jgi:hypothetical protein
MDRLPSHQAFFQIFSAKRDEGTLQPLRNDINWLLMLPQGAELAQSDSDALDAAITRLVRACAESQSATAENLDWTLSFISACDDLQVIDKRTPMHIDAPQHRSNEVFLALQQVLFHPLSSDLVVEQALFFLDKLLPPPQHSNIPCETDWKPFYHLFKQSVCSRISYRTMAPCPYPLAILASNTMQKVANYFSPSSASEIICELRAAVAAGHFVDAAILTTFLPPSPACMADALTDIFSLWDLTLDCRQPLQQRKALDHCCISSLACIAHFTLFPSPPHSSTAQSKDVSLDSGHWSPHISAIFSHAARVMCTFNDGNLLYTPPLSDADNALVSREVLVDLSNLIMCLMFISPDDVSPMIGALYSSVEHLLNPLASSDAPKVRNAILLVWQTSFFFIELMARFDLMPVSFQRVQHSHVEQYIQQLMPILLALLPMSPSTAGRCLRRLYIFRPDLVSPAITASISLILQRSVDCPDAFNCIPAVFREFNDALFVPLHRAVDSLLQHHIGVIQDERPKDPQAQKASVDEILIEIKRVHLATAELPLHTRQTGSNEDAFAFMQLLPDISEMLLERVDPGVESSAEALEFFHFVWSSMPSIPLPASESLLAGLSSAALNCIKKINTFFVQPASTSPVSFCARFFSQVLIFCDHADQPDSWSVDGESQMGPKSEAKRQREAWFKPCIERFLIHLPLRDDAGAQCVKGVFCFDDALDLLLQFCSVNTALQLPVHTYACVGACMDAHDLITAKKFMPFLMQKLLRPATSESIKESGADSPMPVRHNRVLSTRNEKVLRYYAGLLDTILSSVRTNACRSFIMEYVHLVYDLDKFLLATRQHSAVANKAGDSSAKKKKTRARMRARSSSHDVHDRGNEEVNLALEFEALSTSKNGDKSGRKHKVKNLFSDGCDLVASLLRCFTATTVAESVMVPPSMWNSHLWQQMHFVSWGRPVTLEGVAVAFEIPTEDHLRCASAIFRKFAIVPLHAITDIMNGGAVPEDDIDEFKYLQREVSMITSCVRASRMFISPFPDASSTPRPLSLSRSFPSPPKSFGSLLLPSHGSFNFSPSTPSPRPDSLSESSQFDWDNICSRGVDAPASQTRTSEATFITDRSSDLAQKMFQAYIKDYASERPVSRNRQAHTLPGVSLQQLVSSLNSFLSWTLTAQSRDGVRYCDMPSLSRAILALYEAVFGFGPANFAIPTKKPMAPCHHITSLKHGPLFKRDDLLPDLEIFYLKNHEAICWLPCLANDIAPNLLLPAINLIIPFALNASDDVKTQAHVTLASVISRTGPCGVAQVACSTLQYLSDPSLSDDDVPGLMKLMQKLAAIYKNDWILSVALSTRLLQSRSRSYKNAEAIKCIDDMWRMTFASARWSPASAPSRLTSDCLLPLTFGHDVSSPAPSTVVADIPPSQIQDSVIRVMQSDWSKLHGKYQQRCLALLAEATSKDAPLSLDQWAFLWQLLPRTVGFGSGEKGAKCAPAYMQLLSMFEVALIALCPPSWSSSSSIGSLAPLSFPLLDSGGNVQIPKLCDSPSLAAVMPLIRLLDNDVFTASFVLAAAAAYEEEKRGEDFKQQSHDVPLRTLRISVFRLCIEVLGLPFFNKVCQPYFSSLNGEFVNKFLSPPFFPKFNDQEAMDSYMYLSIDILVGCLLGSLSLPQQLQAQLTSCMLNNVSTLTLSNQAMPQPYRWVGGLQKELAV